jgi:tetrahydromethanopterin S-methyltransferase subunit G
MGIFDKLKKLFYKTKIEEKSENKEEKTVDESSFGYLDNLNRDILILKTLKNIEENLRRIENKIDFNLPTKDWILANISSKQDFEKILERLAEINEKIGEKLGKQKSEIIEKIVKIVKERKEISYDELASLIGISRSYLRYILSTTEIPNVGKTIKNKKGYLFYIDQSNITQ